MTEYPSSETSIKYGAFEDWFMGTERTTYVTGVDLIRLKKAFADERKAALDEAVDIASLYPEDARDLRHDTDRVICKTADRIAERIRALAAGGNVADKEKQ